MGKNAICYFSATGNGYYIAQELQKHLQGELWYIPNVIGKNFVEYEKVIIVTPIYMFALPNIVKTFINSLTGQEGPDYYVVLNYGGFSSNVPYYTKKLFEKNGLKLHNVFKIIMSVTYTLFIREPKFIVNRLVKKLEKGRKLLKN